MQFFESLNKKVSPRELYSLGSSVDESYDYSKYKRKPLIMTDILSERLGAVERSNKLDIDNGNEPDYYDSSDDEDIQKESLRVKPKRMVTKRYLDSFIRRILESSTDDDNVKLVLVQRRTRRRRRVKRRLSDHLPGFSKIRKTKDILKNRQKTHQRKRKTFTSVKNLSLLFKRMKIEHSTKEKNQTMDILEQEQKSELQQRNLFLFQNGENSSEEEQESHISHRERQKNRLLHGKRQRDKASLKKKGQTEKDLHGKKRRKVYDPLDARPSFIREPVVSSNATTDEGLDIGDSSIFSTDEIEELPKQLNENNFSPDSEIDVVNYDENTSKDIRKRLLRPSRPDWMLDLSSSTN